MRAGFRGAVAIVFVLMPAGASAARPELSLTKADQAVQRAVAEDVAAMNLPEYAEAGEATVLSYRVEPCDRESRYRALCDYTENWSDGSTCDQTAEVIESYPAGHRERIIVKLPEYLDEELDCYGST